jgi:hypothetical protein
VVDAIDASRDVRIQPPCRFLVDVDLECSNRIPGTPSRAKAVAVWFKLRFPCGLQPMFDPRWLGAIGPGRHPQGTRRRRAGCGKIHPTARRRVALAVQVWHHVQPLLGRQLGHPIDAWCLLPLVILRDVPYRYQFRGTGAAPPCLESAALPVIPTLGGSVAAFWELQHRAFDVDPAPGVPVLPRSDSRVHHVCTPTHTSPVPTSVLPSAYPLAFPVAFAS